MGRFGGCVKYQKVRKVTGVTKVIGVIRVKRVKDEILLSLEFLLI